MKTFLASAALSLALCLVIGTSTGCLSTQSTQAPAAPKPNFVGDWLGQWTGQDQSSGALKLKVTRDQDSTLKLQAVFTYGPADVPTRTLSLKIDGNKIEAAFAWEIEGTAASTRIVGELTGEQMGGTYDSTTPEGAATGKWNAARVPPR